MNDVGEVCSICFDVFEDPVMLPCGHKLCMKCAQSMSTVNIEKENKFNGNPFLSIDAAEYGITCPYRCSKIKNEVRRSSYDYMVMHSPDICLRSFIICFLIDGSHKYMEMTMRSINSLMMSTPVVFIGILVPPLFDTSDIYSRVIDPTRVIFKEYKLHFDKWNPTQHKLDIAQFANEFSIIFWLDSDTYVYKDLTPLLMEFRFSNSKFAFVADHVCTNPEFLGNWKNKHSPFIPQACFMGFRREYMNSFFNLWEEIWRSWIEPAPFHNYPDPLPSFAGSSFCIEQYALGMTIDKFGLSREDIFELRRVCIPLGGLLDSGASVSAPTSPQFHEDNNINNNNNTFITPVTSPQFLSPVNFPRHKKLKRAKKGKPSSDDLFHHNNAELGEGGEGDDTHKLTINLNFPPFTNYNDFPAKAIDTPKMVAEMERAFLAHMSSFGSNTLSQSSYSFSSSASSARSFWIDDIEGYIIHFYSLHYDITFAWFTNHKNMIMSRTEEYWAPKFIPPLDL